MPRLSGPVLLAAGVLAAALSGCSDAPSTAAPAPPAPSPSPVTSEPAFSAVRELARSQVPVRVRIPSLGVDAPVGPVGKAADGTVEVPTRWEDVGWYDAGARPGEDGPTVLLGHVDSKAGPAVFARLPQAPPGTVVEVVGDGGELTRWRVERTEQHPKTRFPTEAVYLPALRPELRLVTCGGAFDRATGHYVDNVVVHASLVQA
jgi:sortase (surface protein transpeptidase)